ncbi:Heterokaryon incompatibility protein 6, OR allele [Madurella mycetomatis]|uniref:Heterokaryon incompatibility protein 6, OR allele n=1 Tax=Madurella mycetomatis TaxID=100816 RepID=A0A175VWQ4_9PEZI|nr:Heterokaryon incompatibility protein 6, OR allele [Madurella mycetomatis]
MACIELIDAAGSEGVDPESGLCQACHQINFLGLLTIGSYSAPCEVHKDTVLPNQLEIGTHYHIGTLRHIQRKASICSGCRLFYAAASPVDLTDDTILDSLITIRAQFLNHDQEVIEVVLNQDMPDELIVGGIVCTDLTSLDSRPEELTLPTAVIPPESTIVGREVGPYANLDYIRRWIRHCDEMHGGACSGQAGNRQTVQPKRLIDVVERCIVLAPSEASYFALSYVWGRDMIPLLTRETLERYSTAGGLGVGYDLLPRTIADAMVLVAELGGRYLWVDNLCIMQDDDKEKQHQVFRMDDIYRGAAVVVVVAAAAASDANANAGIPGIGAPRRRRGVGQRLETIRDLRLVNVPPRMLQAVDLTPWSSRGWTYQEAMLARRILVFTDHLAYWNCKVHAWSEELSRADGAPAPPNIPLAYGSSSWERRTQLRVPCNTTEYCEYVELFTRRDFTYEGDKLWAFLGILKLLAPRFPDGFIWGVPYECLDAALLWYRRYHCCHSISQRTIDCHLIFHNDGAYALPFPSWSWLAAYHGIEFLAPCNDAVVSEVVWHEPIKLRDGQNEMIFQKYKVNRANHIDHDADLAMASFEYGFLQLTAKTAKLTLRVESTYREQDDREMCLEATIHIASGESIGKIQVPQSFFRDATVAPGELMLLSTSFEHGDGHGDNCQCKRWRNAMLIEEDEDGVARRIGLTRIDLDDWAKVETAERRIVLG